MGGMSMTIRQFRSVLLFQPASHVRTHSASVAGLYTHHRIVTGHCRRIHHLHSLSSLCASGTVAPLSSPTGRHPWPEWPKLIHSLVFRGYFIGEGFFYPEDAFRDTQDLTEEFVLSARSCLELARAKPHLIRVLSRKDVELLVENGEPFLFRDSEECRRRASAFLDYKEGSCAMVDVMKYLLSYVRFPYEQQGRRSLEAAVRYLLRDLDLMIDSGGGTGAYKRYSIGMKKGDWICPKCSFMNFARNVKCVECEVLRPKRVSVNGEWECPVCDFYNYPRNVVCMRCEGERPIRYGIEASPAASLSERVEGILGRADVLKNQSGLSCSSIREGLDMSEEAKVERWFKRVADIKDISELSKIPNEDFPSVMPMRKGVNRFVVSKRKTPLERRLASTDTHKS